MAVASASLLLPLVLVASPPEPGPTAGDSASSFTVKISLDSKPSGALVLIDGEALLDPGGRLARTPLSDFTLELPSRSKMTLVKEGYWPHAQILTPGLVRSTSPTKPLQVKLLSEPVPPAATVATLATVAAPPPTPPRPAGCARLADEYGHVTIASEPQVAVYLDGKLLGETPIAKARVPAGCLHLDAVDPSSKREKRIKINVEPNKVTRFKITL